jgi:hypothetical protein
MAATLDTLQIAKRLKEAGFGDSRAEAVTGVFREFQESDRSDLATRADVERLEGGLERLETKLSMLIEVKSAAIKNDVIRWLVGVAFAEAALVVAILKLFPSGHP